MGQGLDAIVGKVSLSAFERCATCLSFVGLGEVAFESHHLVDFLPGSVVAPGRYQNMIYPVLPIFPPGCPIFKSFRSIHIYFLRKK